MAELQPALPEMFDEVFPLLTELNPHLSQAEWRALYDYDWRADGDGLGWVLRDDGVVVGYIGTLFSRRTIGGQPVRLCNSAHWIVREPWRGESLRLLMRVLRERDCTFTSLTSSGPVATVFAKLGFKVMEERQILLLPAPVLPRLAGGATITSDPAALRATLVGEDARIFADHQGPRVRHVLVRDGGAYCYLVLTRLRKRVAGLDLPYGHVLYVSDRALFRRHLARIKWHCLRRFGAVLLLVDDRLVDVPPGLLHRPRPLGVPRLYKSATLEPSQIDTLYTELSVGLY